MVPTDKFKETVSDGNLTANVAKTDNSSPKPSGGEREHRAIMVSKIEGLLRWACDKSKNLTNN